MHIEHSEHLINQYIHCPNCDKNDRINQSIDHQHHHHHLYLLYCSEGFDWGLNGKLATIITIDQNHPLCHYGHHLHHHFHSYHHHLRQHHQFPSDEQRAGWYLEVGLGLTEPAVKLLSLSLQFVRITIITIITIIVVINIITIIVIITAYTQNNYGTNTFRYSFRW